jgi:hypothetical protein
LGVISVFGYLQIVVGLTLLVLTLSRVISGPAVAGALAGCTAVSLAIGVALLPVSIVGTLFLFLGLLGFSPFVTAFVFARNAWRAWAAAVRVNPQRNNLARAALGMLLAVGVPAAVQLGVNRITDLCIDRILHRQDPGWTVPALRSVRWLTEFDRFEDPYRADPNNDLGKKLGEVYKEITGFVIWTRFNRFND